MSRCVYRPWYVEASTPVPKDIIIIIDRSGSMNDDNHMSTAKEAAKTVIGTLNPNDRVGMTVRQCIHLGAVWRGSCIARPSPCLLRLT